MRCFAFVLACLVPAVAGAAPRSSWNPSRTAIYTAFDDGTTRLGGSVDGVAMVQFHASLGPGPRVDFVRSTTDAGGPLRWRSSCVYVTPDAGGTDDLPDDRETQVLQDVLAHWTDATAGCGALTFVLDEPEAREVGYDGSNVVKYRHDTWCRPGEEGEAPECYSSSAAAITTLFFIDRPGESDDGIILDADIEFNAVDFAIGDGCEDVCESNGSGIMADLENTMTHEIGHLVGLDHTCWEGNAADAPLDQNGDAAPQCFPEVTLSTEVKDATMYNFQTPGETKKRTLEADDVAGFCAIYPTSREASCARVDISGDDGWCAIAPAAPGRRIGWAAPASLLALLGIAFAASVRRRP